MINNMIKQEGQSLKQNPISLPEQPHKQPIKNYYHSLARYKPLCYSGKGVPIFLVAKDGCTSSLPCIVFINILFIMVIILSSINYMDSNDRDFVMMMRNVQIIVIIFLNIFYALVVLLNPGVISQQDLQISDDQQYRYCGRCKIRINQDMKHCLQCQVCVVDMDHHCGFFQKCIAGRQRFAFFGFIAFIFAGFICILGGLSMLLSPK